jgi:hypothetical protein
MFVRFTYEAILSFSFRLGKEVNDYFNQVILELGSMFILYSPVIQGRSSEKAQYLFDVRIFLMAEISSNSNCQVPMPIIGLKHQTRSG